MKKIIHFIYKLRHYFQKPQRMVPIPKIKTRRLPKVIMQDQVDLETAMEIARQWDKEDVNSPPHRR